MLTFEFNGVRGVMTQDTSLTSGMVGRPVKLIFSPEWEELRKTAVFRAGDVIRDVLDVKEETLIPARVLETPFHRLYVGIYGTNEEGNLVIPTVWAQGPMIEEGTEPSGDPSTEPDNPVWQQILAMLGNLDDLNTSARENLVAAINEAAQTGGSGNGGIDASTLQTAINEALAQAKASGAFDGVDGHTPQKGVDYWTEEDKAEIVAEIMAGLSDAEEVAF